MVIEIVVETLADNIKTTGYNCSLHTEGLIM